MSRVVVLVLASLVCLGCQPRSRMYWFSAERTLEQIVADCRECHRQALARAQEEHVLRYRDSVERDRPWQMDNELLEQANRELDEANTFNGCMTGKGYRQVRGFPLGVKVRTKDCFGGDSLQHLAGQ
ncbi:MAG: hypothetical protein RBS72_03845 [Sedimentisphaerales bacterium]|nr:hypothetical protein [Sedimentisphaerales bacterium]HNY80089.1 hypothetical protein [Sedimentisphaerales bacterium]HOC65546.1 hypothetical protein [Sedimentisphaerales bacterium]HOH66542.1 hypothetical protein [Sedimentisphaerales bacterium]HQA90550.1 hypothetical protein [Sedimentisphaerales bacterium]